MDNGLREFEEIKKLQKRLKNGGYASSIWDFDCKTVLVYHAIFDLTEKKINEITKCLVLFKNGKTRKKGNCIEIKEYRKDILHISLG